MKLQKGFTLIETLIVLGITAVLFTVITFNLAKAQRSSVLNSTVTTLISDIKSQQLKAMTGGTEGRSESDNYGLYFQQNSYTLFHGASFISGSNTNFVINTDSTISISATFSNNSLIFSRMSGEVSNFISGQNTIKLTNSSDGSSKIITINRYGVVTGVN